MKKCRSYFDDIKVSRVFPCFFLAAFEAGGHRPQPQGLRASASRKGRRLGVKTGGVPLGFKRSKMFFMVFIFVLRICQHTSDTQKKPRKTFQPFSISCNLLLFSLLCLNGLKAKPVINPS